MKCGNDTNSNINIKTSGHIIKQRNNVNSEHEMFRDLSLFAVSKQGTEEVFWCIVFDTHTPDLIIDWLASSLCMPMHESNKSI
mmetsp:Transcript_15161/g.23530  ORF Transcript_15161/g.23530 Transcript_15161/m.23530 type:complete len:83 (+) Transcript_15161:490-738(+)